METIGNAIIFYGLKVVMAAVIFFVGKFIAGWLRGLVAGLMKKKDMDVAIQQFVSTLVYYALLTFVCIAALGQLGIQTASLVAVVGAAGLAVGQFCRRCADPDFSSLPCWRLC